MMDRRKEGTLNTSRIIIFITCLLLVLTLGIIAVFSYFAPEKPMASRDEIYENIESFVPDDTVEYKYAATYLDKFGIRGFNTLKFKELEKLFRDESIYEIPSPEVMSHETAKLFMSNYYDKIDLTDESALTDALMSCYVKYINGQKIDQYAVYRTKVQYGDYKQEMSGSFAGIGVEILYDKVLNEITVKSVMEGSGAEDAGILVGDKIIGADGKTLDEVGQEELLSMIRGEVGTPVDITVLRGEETVTLTVIRKQVVEKSVTYSLNDEKIGYVKITGFKKNTDEQFKEAIDYLTENGAVGIIFDMRDNPGGYLDSVVAAIDYLVPDGTRIASYNTSKKETVYTAKDGHEVSIPLAVVFNKDTASAGELFSAAIRDYDNMGVLEAVSIGEKDPKYPEKTTYAKGIMQSTYTFSDESTLTLTIAYYNPPSNENYDGVGVNPDFHVLQENGKDAPLDKAYTEIKKLIDN